MHLRLKEKPKHGGKGLLKLHEEMGTTRHMVVPGPKPPPGAMLNVNVDPNGGRHFDAYMGKGNQEENKE